MDLTKQQITEIFTPIGAKHPYADGMMFISVETGGLAFTKSAAGVNRIVIQFEPHVFAQQLAARGIKYSLTKKYLNGKTYYAIEVPKAKMLVSKGKDDTAIADGSWHIINGVEGQDSEYKAFSIAMSINPDAAMMATSWGGGQIMGHHFARLGYKSVGDMVSDFKISEYNQILGVAKFIKTDAKLLGAFIAHNYNMISYYYNGANYMVNNYPAKLGKAHTRYLQIAA